MASGAPPLARCDLPLIRTFTYGTEEVNIMLISRWWRIPQPSDFVPLKSVFFLVSVHRLTNITLLTLWYKLIQRGVADLHP